MEAEAEQASKNLLLELSEYCEKLGHPNLEHLFEKEFFMKNF